MGNRKAVLVGINYPGTQFALRGCVNDVMAMKEVLVNNYGFTDPTQVKVLTDGQATTVNMINHLEWLVGGSAPGDVLFFHYSGHGSQLPDGSDADPEPDGLDEIICPIDLDWKAKVIRDDDLRRVFDKIPPGVSLTVVLDCCNSGGAMDQFNQYQPLGIGAAREILSEGEEFVNRYMPMPEHLMEEVRAYQLQVKPSTMLTRSVQEIGMLITGCQSQQTSADAWIGGKYMGAATYYITQTMKEHNFDLDYKTLIDGVNNQIAAAGYTQRPELNGNATLFTSKVLQPLGKSDGVDEGGVTPPVDDETVYEMDEGNFFSKIWNAIVGFFKKLFGR